MNISIRFIFGLDLCWRNIQFKNKDESFPLKRKSSFLLKRKSSFLLKRKSSFPLKRKSSFSLLRKSSFPLKRKSSYSLKRKSSYSLKRKSSFPLIHKSNFPLNRKSSFPLKRKSMFHNIIILLENRIQFKTKNISIKKKIITMTICSIELRIIHIFLFAINTNIIMQPFKL